MNTKTTANFTPRQVINVMRRILKQQVTDSSMPRDVVKFITDQSLIRQVEWPAFLMQLTNAGADYIAENSDDDDGIIDRPLGPDDR